MSDSRRILPDPDKYPHNLVVLTVWERNTRGGSTGRNYFNNSGKWSWIRDHAVSLDQNQRYHWEFDGFRIGKFSRAWWKIEENNPPVLVRLAVWALERWAKDEGLIR